MRVCGCYRTRKDVSCRSALCAVSLSTTTASRSRPSGDRLSYDCSRISPVTCTASTLDNKTSLFNQFAHKPPRATCHGVPPHCLRPRHHKPHPNRISVINSISRTPRKPCSDGCACHLHVPSSITSKNKTRILGVCNEQKSDVAVAQEYQVSVGKC